MATSPDFLRLASSAARTLADTALDSLRDAVLVVDARYKHLPVVLANDAARRHLADDGVLVEVPLPRLLGSALAARLASLFTSLADLKSPAERVRRWRLHDGEADAMTQLTPLESAAGPRLAIG